MEKIYFTPGGELERAQDKVMLVLAFKSNNNGKKSISDLKQKTRKSYRSEGNISFKN